MKDEDNKFEAFTISFSVRLEPEFQAVELIEGKQYGFFSRVVADLEVTKVESEIVGIIIGDDSGWQREQMNFFMKHIEAALRTTAKRFNDFSRHTFHPYPFNQYEDEKTVLQFMEEFRKQFYGEELKFVFYVSPIPSKRGGSKSAFDLSSFLIIYNGILPKVQAAKAVYKANRKSLHWKIHVQTAFPDLPIDLISRLSGNPADLTEELKITLATQGGTSMPSDIACEWAARLCGATDYFYKLKTLKDKITEQRKIFKENGRFQTSHLKLVETM